MTLHLQRESVCVCVCVCVCVSQLGLCYVTRVIRTRRQQQTVTLLQLSPAGGGVELDLPWCRRMCVCVCVCVCTCVCVWQPGVSDLISCLIKLRLHHEELRLDCRAETLHQTPFRFNLVNDLIKNVSFLVAESRFGVQTGGNCLMTSY